MNKKSIALNIIWSIISLVINTAINMLILPYVSDEIGIEAYGYIALCNNIITYINLIASTINIYAIRFISIEYHKGDLKKANDYYNSVLVADVFIAMSLLIPATLGIVHIDQLLSVPEFLVDEVRLLFIFTLINYIITIVGTVFASAAFVKDVLYMDTKYKAEANILKASILLITFACFTPHVWYVSLATIAYTVYIVVKNVYLTHRIAPEFKIDIKRFSVKAIREIVSNGIWNTIASLGTTLNSGLDLLVTNIYLGATMMGQLSVPKTLSSFIEVLLGAVSNSFRPQLLKAYSKGEKQKLNNGFLLAMKTCGAFTSIIFSVFFVIGQPFFDLWIPNENTVLIYRLTILTFLAEVFTGVVKPLHYGCVLTGKLKIPCICNLLVGLFNVVSMLCLLSTTDYGLYVVVLTTVVGNVAYCFVIMPIYVVKILKMKYSDVYITIFKYLISTCLISLVLSVGFRNIQVDSWLTLILFGGIAAVVAGVIYIIMMFNSLEKKNMFHMVKRKFRRNV